MTWTEIESVFENCRDMCKKANRKPYFYITGGDPILHSRFWDLMELFKAHNIAFTILGNPFHLNDDVCKKLKYYGCERYQLSIDGLRETHYAMRKKGSFDTTIEKLKCLHKAGIRSAIMTTVSGVNAEKLPGIIDLVVENKVNVFAFARYAPTSYEKSIHLTPEKYRIERTAIRNTVRSSRKSQSGKWKRSNYYLYLRRYLWSGRNSNFSSCELAFL